MGAVVAVSFDLGGVGRVQFRDDLTDEEIQFAIDKTKWHPEDGTPVSWRRVSLADFPAAGTFRSAWEDTGQQIAVDMPKAREIHRQHMRDARAPILEALDVEYQIADEGTNDNGAAGSAAKLAKKAIAVQKQALRDVTADPAIDAAQTPEELEAVWPAILAGS